MSCIFRKKHLAGPLPLPPPAFTFLGLMFFRLAQLSFIGIVAEFTAGLLGLLVGAGYIRGICEAPLQSSGRILGLIWWDSPLPC